MKKLTAIDYRLFIGCSCRILDPSGYRPLVNYPDNIEAIIASIDGINVRDNKILWNYKEYDPSIVKPILRRFNSLTRSEIEELNKLWPKENIKRTTQDSIVLDAEIINYLTSKTIDVFGWIDLDLAFDAEYFSYL